MIDENILLVCIKISHCCKLPAVIMAKRDECTLALALAIVVSQREQTRPHHVDLLLDKPLPGTVDGLTTSMPCTRFQGKRHLFPSSKLQSPRLSQVCWVLHVHSFLVWQETCRKSY